MTVKKDFEVIREGEEDVLKINYESVPYSPSIEEEPNVMMDVIDKLAENPSVSRLVFSQRRYYNYNFEQTQMLAEIANIYSYLTKRKRALSAEAMGTSFEAPGILAERHSLVRGIVYDLMRSDPLGAYVELKRQLRLEKIKQKETSDPNAVASREVFVKLLDEIYDLLDKTKLISVSKPYLAGYNLGDREIYRLFLRPTITPDFLFTRVMARPPIDGEELDIYTIDKNTEVTIFSVPNDIKPLYHLNPPEFKLTEDKYALVDLAKNVLSEHQPRNEQFLDPEKLRLTFGNIGRDLLRELADNQNMDLTTKELKELTEILIRHTIGFGFIELLMKDKNIQDIQVNSPNGEVPLFVLHGQYDNCTTNIIPARSDVESWASKFRLLSGRPLDEANPILDTELQLPDARSRVSIVTRPLNPYGLAYSFRRHRDDPWTMALFTKNRMLNPMAAGLMSFLIDGARTMLVAGTRSSGKTSLLNAVLVEVMRKHRIITVEDSVTGDTELVSFSKDSGYKISTFEELFNNYNQNKGIIDEREVVYNPGIKVFSMDNHGKIVLKDVSKLIRHKVNKPIYEILTATGRMIKVTGDHSLFRLGEKEVKEEIKVSELKQGDFLVTPRLLNIQNKDWQYYDSREDLVKHLDRKLFVSGNKLKAALSRAKLKIAAKKYGHHKSVVSRWLRDGILPLNVVHSLNLISKVDQFKLSGNSEFIPVEIKFGNDFLMFVGLWLADGCYDKNSIILSVVSEEERALVNRVAAKFGFTIKWHSDKISLMINSKSLKFFMKDILGLTGNAFTKRIPKWAFNLSKKQMGCILNGIFTGDGCVSNKEIMLSLASRGLMYDIQTILLNYGVIFRISQQRELKIKKKDYTYDGRISSLKSIKLFAEIGLLHNSKKSKLAKLMSKVSTHDSTDVIPLPLSIRVEISSILGNRDFKKKDYLYGKCNVGREKLIRVVSSLSKKCKNKSLISYLKALSESDIYWDKIVRIKVLNNSQYVYDLSVPGYENFICNNILAHNTLELSTTALRKLGYDIQPLKVRSALVEGGSELSASEGIRTSLRLGDSALIIGEVRSKEAIALYESMRIGALANIVAGTIHGDSPYGVFDRVVNDLGVPRTSFKATDIIVVANPIRSPDGLHKWRRVTQITEVRKEWEEDPLAEGGFVDLMKYNSATDQLEITPALMNGESEILKSIGANVKEWAGNWDAIWDNIQLRADIKRLLVDYSTRLKNDSMLEAPFVIQSNDMFHRISSSVRDELGYLDSKRIIFEWEDWLKRVIRREQLPK